MKTIHGTRACQYCGTEYKDSHASVRTCSTSCGNALRRQKVMRQHEIKIGEPLSSFIPRRMNEGAKMQEIAAELECNYRTLMHHMRDLGIERRSRSDAVALQWKDNESRRAAWGQTISEWKRSNPESAMAHSLVGNVALQNTSPTSIERRLMGALDSAGIDYQFQYVVGDKFLCDLAFPDAMLIVECDGSYWHRTPKQQARDTSKDAYLRKCGYTVLRLADKQIEQNIDGCVQAIQSCLKVRE